jgi:hypothetical protein
MRDLGLRRYCSLELNGLEGQEYGDPVSPVSISLSASDSTPSVGQARI